MKKSIIISIGAVFGICAITAVAVFVPAAKSMIGYSPIIVNNGKTFNPNTAPNANASYQQALLGTKKINNGNYVLYVGSLAYVNNATFLLGSTPGGNPYKPQNLASNISYPLAGSYGTALDYMKNNPDLFAVHPEFVAILNTITPAELKQEETFNNLINEYLNLKITSSSTSEEIAAIQKKKQWAEQNKNSFSYIPGAVYSNLEGKQVPFINSQQTKEFLNIVTYMKTKFPKMQNLDQSPGFVIGYKNGKPVAEYTESFIQDNKDDKKENNAATSLSYIQSVVARNNAEETNNQQSTIAPTSNFYTWLKTNYATK